MDKATLGLNPLFISSFHTRVHKSVWNKICATMLFAEYNQASFVQPMLPRLNAPSLVRFIEKMLSAIGVNKT